MPDLDLLRGTLDLFILKALTWGPRHGLAVADWIRHMSGDLLTIQEGALYPALHRMEQRGLLAAEWGLTNEGRRAKYYTLTARGRHEFAARVATWDRYVSAASRVLSATHASI